MSQIILLQRLNRILLLQCTSKERTKWSFTCSVVHSLDHSRPMSYLHWSLSLGKHICCHQINFLCKSCTLDPSPMLDSLHRCCRKLEMKSYCRKMNSSLVWVWRWNNNNVVLLFKNNIFDMRRLSGSVENSQSIRHVDGLVTSTGAVTHTNSFWKSTFPNRHVDCPLLLLLSVMLH